MTISKYDAKRKFFVVMQINDDSILSKFLSSKYYYAIINQISEILIDYFY